MIRRAAAAALLLGALSACGRRQAGNRAELASPAPARSARPTEDQCDFSAYRPLRASVESQVVRKRVPPVLPPGDLRVEGVVWVDVLVDEQGNAVRACATRGPDLLRVASQKAALGWKFEPLLLNGTPRPYVHTISFEYRLGSHSGVGR